MADNNMEKKWKDNY